MRKIKVGIVNYLNTAPLIYGLEQTEISKEIELIPDYPARLAADLQNGSIDLGLVPVAVIPQLKEWHVVSDFCIGCDGPVASVCLFSEVPMEEIRTVLLDDQSRTSIALAKILLKEYWKVNVKFQPGHGDFRKEIRGSTAAVVIGDRALEQRRVSKYIYDLGAAWKDHTGLPFVFAAWIANKPLDSNFISRFNEANAAGLQQLSKVIAAHPYDVFDLHEYYTRYISYELTMPKKRGLENFLERITVSA